MKASQIRPNSEYCVVKVTEFAKEPFPPCVMASSAITQPARVNSRSPKMRPTAYPQPAHQKDGLPYRQKSGSSPQTHTPRIAMMPCIVVIGAMIFGCAPSTEDGSVPNALIIMYAIHKNTIGVTT